MWLYARHISTDSRPKRGSRLSSVNSQAAAGLCGTKRLLYRKTALTTKIAACRITRWLPFYADGSLNRRRAFLTEHILKFYSNHSGISTGQSRMLSIRPARRSSPGSRRRESMTHSAIHRASNCRVTQSIYLKSAGLDSTRAGMSRESLANVTVSRRGKHWFVSIQTEMEVGDPKHSSASTVGIDLGVKRFATLSDGTFYEPANSFRKLEGKGGREQRKLSCKVEGSKNWYKQKNIIAPLHIRIADTRNDYLHKTSTTISKNHAVVVLEDLKVSNMSASARGTIENPVKGSRQKQDSIRLFWIRAGINSEGCSNTSCVERRYSACHRSEVHFPGVSGLSSCEQRQS